MERLQILKLRRRRPGFTLIEMLICIAITGIISLVLGVSIIQTLTVYSADTNRTEAVTQVENALHWINRDVQQTSPAFVQIITGASGEQDLKLEWTDSTVNPAATHNVTYDYDPAAQELRRVEGTARTLIGTNISDVEYIVNDNVVTVNITATANGYKTVSQSRALNISLRITND